MPTIEQLQRLVKNKMSPDEVLANVSEQPIVNSFDGKFKNIVGFIDMIPTPGKEKWFRSLQTDDDVIYWKSAESDAGVEIIGIVWSETGNSHIFCGTILPP